MVSQYLDIYGSVELLHLIIDKAYKMLQQNGKQCIF